MIESIKKCKKCGLCKYQTPLMESSKKCQVFWVGLSAKKKTFDNEIPLSPTTNSGKIISDIENRCSSVLTYKTNLVKCVPLDEHGKLRYPNNREMDMCFSNLEEEITDLKPRVIFLLGTKVTDVVSRHLKFTFEPWSGFDYKYIIHNEVYYVPIHHPSYIHIYKRKDMEKYILGIENVITKLLYENEMH